VLVGDPAAIHAPIFASERLRADSPVPGCRPAADQRYAASRPRMRRAGKSSCAPALPPPRV
jgi:hypothetical protein